MFSAIFSAKQAHLYDRRYSTTCQKYTRSEDIFIILNRLHVIIIVHHRHEHRHYQHNTIIITNRAHGVCHPYAITYRIRDHTHRAYILFRQVQVQAGLCSAKAACVVMPGLPQCHKKKFPFKSHHIAVYLYNNSIYWAYVTLLYVLSDRYVF